MALALAGCSTDSTGPVGDAQVGNAIDGALRPHVSAGSVELDLSTVVDGTWDSVLVVCRNATTTSVKKGSGVDLEFSPKPGSASFLSAIVFVHDKAVVKYFNVGQDDDVTNHWYFDPCPSELPEDPAANVVVLDRDDATLALEYVGDDDPDFSYWQSPAMPSPSG